LTHRRRRARGARLERRGGSGQCGGSPASQVQYDRGDDARDAPV